MFIERKKLRLIIENYLLEQDTESEDSQETEGESEASGTASQEFEIGNVTFKISVNSKSGVAVEIQRDGVESKKHLVTKEDLSDTKNPDVLELLKILAGIGKFVEAKNTRKSDFQSLIKAINGYAGKPVLGVNQSTFRTHLVNFISKYGKIS